MINSGSIDGPQNTIGNVCRTGDLQEVTASTNHMIGATAANTPPTRFWNSPKGSRLQNMPASRRLAVAPGTPRRGGARNENGDASRFPLESRGPEDTLAVAMRA